MNTYTASSTFRALSIASCLALAAGCGTPDPIADDTTGASTAALLEQPNGGLSTDPEMPEFGDPSFGALPAMSDSVGTDALLDASGSFAGDTAPAAQRHVFRVMILWGHLPRATDTATPAMPPARPTNWNGSIGVANARVSVRRTLGFEDRDAVAARSAPERVSFTSTTQPFVDGLILTVRTPEATPTLLFRTSALNADLPLPDSDGAVRYLGDARNGVYYAAYEDRPACNQGFLFGRWSRARARLGVFRGRAIDATGAPSGTVRGVWGARRSGEQVFFGKHISNAGAFNGLLGGTYRDGRFSGHWGTRAGDRGELHGRFFDGFEQGDNAGVFLGRWREACR